VGQEREKKHGRGGTDHPAQPSATSEYKGKRGLKHERQADFFRGVEPNVTLLVEKIGERSQPTGFSGVNWGGVQGEEGVGSS